MDSYASERLLLSLLRGEMPAAPSASPVDPAALVELCRRHRVTTLIYQAGSRLGGILPPEVLSPLREGARKILVDNLILLKALLDLASALTEEGTGFVLLKGVSLLGFLYPEIQQRPMSDLDLLIREKDWPKVAETLGQRGYRLPFEDEERFYQETWYHQLVESPGTPSCNVEFHWNLESVERSRIDPDELIRDAVACEIEGEKFLRLCDDHLLLHLAVHLAHHYQAPSLHWVEDLRRLLIQGSLNWERIRATARAWRVEGCMAYSLGYVERIFPGVLPGPAKAFRFSPVRRAILRGLSTDDPTLPHRPLADSPLRHAASMALVDRWRDMTRYVVVHSASRIVRVTGVPRVRVQGPAAQEGREHFRAEGARVRRPPGRPGEGGPG